MLDSRRNIALACAPSALAGYVDGIGFLHLGGLIVLGRGANRQPWVLLAEASLLAAAALCYAFDLPNVAIAAIVLAMGMENAVFQIDGGAGLGLTYVTGALVKVGQLAAEALTGGARWGWAPNLLLWAGAGGGFLVRCARLLLDQSCRDLVCRRCCAGVKRDRCRDNSPIANSPTALTADAACPI